MSAKYLLFFRGVLLCSLLLQALHAPGAEAGLRWISLVFAGYALAAVSLFLLDRQGRLSPRQSAWSYLLDLAFAVGVLMLIPGVSPGLHLSFFIVVLSSALLQRPPFSFILAGIASLVYAGLVARDLSRPDQLLHVAMLPVVAFFSSYVVESVRRAERRTSDRYEVRIAGMERLSMVGRALSSVLHELKTPLGTIVLNAEHARELLKRGRGAQEQLDMIGQEAERAGEIIRNHLEFTKPAELERKPLELRSLLARALASMSARAEGKGVETGLLPGPEVVVEGSGRHLTQVFINIFLNAIEAMPLGGTLSVACERVHADARVTVRDTGTGIAPEDLKDVYEPFSTRKKPGGTGLGLSIARWILHKHDGELLVESPGLRRGTTVTVTLPVSGKG